MPRQSTLDITVIPVERMIFPLRGEKVILDKDLAELYGVPTKRLNEQVKRNLERFPEDFMFRLSQDEAGKVQASRSQFATLKRGQNIKYLPYAFTEHGALMAANVLNSPRAVEMSVYVIRAFVRMRREFSGNEVVAKRLAKIEETLLSHDSALRDLFDKLRPLLLPSAHPKPREIGFHVKRGEDGRPKGRRE